MSATPIADAIKQRIRHGDNADHWRNDIGDSKLHTALIRNDIGINTDDTDAWIMAHRTAHPAPPAQRERGQ